MAALGALGPFAAYPGERPLTEPRPGAQLGRWELVFMPQSRPSWGCPATAQSRGKLSLAQPA